MNKILIYVSAIILLFLTYTNAQNDIQIGRPGNGIGNQSGALYDYSDPSNVNFRVQLWGYVANPGFYIIPAGTSLNELISLAGGPSEDANLNDIRIVKMKEGSQTYMQKYNYNDLMWEDKITNQVNYLRLDAGDIVVIPGEPRYFVREDITFFLGILSTLASLTALVISILVLTE